MIVFIAVILVFIGIYGWRLFNKKIISDVLPSKNVLNAVNLPGQLFGPSKLVHALNLDPNKIIEWVNHYRAEENLPLLTLNDKLLAAATTKEKDMFTKQYFEHVSPDGKTPGELVLEAGYDYKTTGENLALGDFKDEKELVDAWMASPGHRANIMNTLYTEIGVASGLNDYQGRNTWISVQEFGLPQAICPAPDNNLSQTIDTKKQDWKDLNETLTETAAAAQTLAKQANDQMNTGNQIYEQTHSKTKAQPYWDQGDVFRKESIQKLAEAQTIDAQLKSLFSEIDTLVNKYNAQVATYNNCIK